MGEPVVETHLDLGASWYDVIDDSLEKIAYHQRRLAGLKQMYEAQEKAIQSKIDWHRHNLEEAAKYAKEKGLGSEVKTPHGVATAKKKKGSFKLKDPQDALVWCWEHKVPTRKKEEPDLSAIRGRLEEQEDGSLVDPSTGEIVKWGRIEGKGEVSVSFTLNE